MKKLICIALMCWLPLFMTAANAMAMQMSLESIHAETIHSEAIYANTNAHAHCHQPSTQVASTHADNQMADTQTGNKPQPSTHSHCTTCGFCVISHAITHQAVTFLTTGTQSTNLVAPAVSFSSVDYPPAIKPPILH